MVAALLIDIFLILMLRLIPLLYLLPSSSSSIKLFFYSLFLLFLRFLLNPLQFQLSYNFIQFLYLLSHPLFLFFLIPDLLDLIYMFIVVVVNNGALYQHSSIFFIVFNGKVVVVMSLF